MRLKVNQRANTLTQFIWVKDVYFRVNYSTNNLHNGKNCGPLLKRSL